MYKFEENYFSTAGKIDALLASSGVSTSVNNMQSNAVESRALEQTPHQGYTRDLSQVHLPKIAISKC